MTVVVTRRIQNNMHFVLVVYFTDNLYTAKTVSRGCPHTLQCTKCGLSWQFLAPVWRSVQQFKTHLHVDSILTLTSPHVSLKLRHECLQAVYSHFRLGKLGTGVQVTELGGSCH